MLSSYKQKTSTIFHLISETLPCQQSMKNFVIPINRFFTLQSIKHVQVQPYISLTTEALMVQIYFQITPSQSFLPFNSVLCCLSFLSFKNIISSSLSEFFLLALCSSLLLIHYHYCFDTCQTYCAT